MKLNSLFQKKYSSYEGILYHQIVIGWINLIIERISIICSEYIYQYNTTPAWEGLIILYILNLHSGE